MLPVGTLPVTVTLHKAKKVEVIHLSHQGICELGRDFESFMNVRQMFLHHNRIQYIKDALYANIRIEYLDLSFNQLRSLSGIEYLKQLQVLIVSHNLLRDLPQLYVILKKLHNLEHIEIEDNPFYYYLDCADHEYHSQSAQQSDLVEQLLRSKLFQLFSGVSCF